MKKKVVSLLLALTLTASLVGCGGGDGADDSSNDGGDSGTQEESNSGTTEGDTSEGGTTESDTTEGDTTEGDTSEGDTAEGGDAESGDVEKPESITIMFDGTVFTEENGREQFITKLEELTGIPEINVIQPDHDAYYDVVGQTIAGGDWPDALILSADKLSSYGEQGVLWDMAGSWEGSDLQARQEENGTKAVVDALVTDGHLYGMPAARGNGCVTYVKQAWLDAAGITSLPTNFEEYYDMLKKMKEAKGTDYVLAASSFLNAEAPYTNYLAEFYQDAYPAFYQQEDGTWADGFAEQSMKDAMTRIATAVSDGILDPESNTYSTGDIRNKFYDDSLGVFTYWAGTWATNLKTNLENNGLDGELAVLNPIAEVGAYVDRIPPTWCITTQCENPEGVYKYFIEAMQDGGDIQFLWTYGVEGTHWSTAAETLYEGTENEKVYADGEFHMLDNLEAPGTQYTKAHIDPMLALTKLANDPSEQTVQPEAKTAQELFNSNSKMAFLVPTTDEMAQMNGDLMTEKQTLVAKVATGQMTVDEAYAEYENGGYADMSQQIVDSLNALGQ